MSSLKKLSRRDILKFSALAAAGLATSSWVRYQPAPQFPAGERLGRVNSGKIDIKAKPDNDSQSVGTLFEDTVVVWLRETVGKNTYRTNQRWVETPDGFIWSPYLQPVRNLSNQPVESMPDNPSLGKGMWVEVSQPYVNLAMDNPPPRSPGFQDRIKNGQQLRLYYSQITWVDQVKTSADGQVLYRVNEKYGSYGDILWGAAEAFRPVTLDEMSPIHPEVENKRIVVRIADQTMACYEGDEEVHFARISSGALYNNEGKRVDAWATPAGKFPIWRKLMSLHMSGGTTGGGWDLPAIGWTSLFVGTGVAIHSTFWHNNFGEPMSKGCVNSTPDDSKWVFRWTQPYVDYDPGDKTVPWPGGTTVQVIED